MGRVNRHSKKHRKAQVGRYKWCLNIVREIVGENGFMTLPEILLKVRATDASLKAMSVSSLGRMMKELKYKRRRLSTHVTYCKPDVLRAKVAAFQIVKSESFRGKSWALKQIAKRSIPARVASPPSATVSAPSSTRAVDGIVTR